MLSYGNDVSRIKSNLLSLWVVAPIMKKHHYHILISISIAMSVFVSGCQSMTGYKKIENAKSAELRSGQIIPIKGEVNIACAGTYHCEITKIDQTKVISTETHRPFDSEMLVSMTNDNGIPYSKLTKREQAQIQANTVPLTNNTSIKIVPLSVSGIKGLVNYYARAKPIKREIHVNFYPENNTDYIERFAMIDEFKNQGTYMLQAYQQESTKDNGSLLDNASPAPLCVDLLKDGKLQRRFCKQMTNERQGEFVETPLSTKQSSKPKAL